MATYTPPGWPAGVHPPGSEDFESTAVGWLLEVVPPDFRLHGVLRRYPVALATLARYHSKACVEGGERGVPPGQARARRGAAAARHRYRARRLPQGGGQTRRHRPCGQPGRTRPARGGLHAEDDRPASRSEHRGGWMTGAREGEDCQVRT